MKKYRRNAISIFLKEERGIAVTVLLAIVFIIIYIASSNVTEWFSLGAEIMSLFYNVSLAIVAAFIFYIFQYYIPAYKARELAEKEIKMQCANWVSTICDILISCCRDQEELDGLNISTLEALLSQNIAMHISRYFDIEQTANVIPKAQWRQHLQNRGLETAKEASSTASKYSIFLTRDMLAILQNLEMEPFIRYVQTNTQDAVNLQKEYHGAAHIPWNLFEDFMKRILYINDKLGLDLDFSVANTGLFRKARLRNLSSTIL